MKKSLIVVLLAISVSFGAKEDNKNCFWEEPVKSNYGIIRNVSYLCLQGNLFVANIEIIGNSNISNANIESLGKSIKSLMPTLTIKTTAPVLDFNGKPTPCGCR